MFMNPDNFDVWQGSGKLVFFECVFYSYPKLAFLQTCGDIWMSLWVYVRINAQGYPCLNSETSCNFVDLLKFKRGFYVEHQDIGFECIGYLLPGLAYTCKDYLLRSNACLQRPE